MRIRPLTMMLALGLATLATSALADSTEQALFGIRVMRHLPGLGACAGGYADGCK